MIIKGGSCSGASRVAAHLLRDDQNEQVAVKDLRGVAGEDLRSALIDMTAYAAGTNCRKPLYHASINPRASERLTEAQWIAAVDQLEAALGLTGQPRAIVEHVKDGRPHRHVVWSRVDLARCRTISDSHNFRIHEQTSRHLEREFGFAPVLGAHAERAGRKRPGRAPDHDEMQQGSRTGFGPQAAKTFITGLWQRTGSGKAFAAQLAEAGWMLARGDRRSFVVLDPQGGVHSLARRIEGATARSIRARMADIDPASLPSVAEARAMFRAKGGRPSAVILSFPRSVMRERPQRLAA